MNTSNGQIGPDKSDIPAPEHKCFLCGKIMTGYRWLNNPQRCQWDCVCGSGSIRSIPIGSLADKKP